MSNQTETFPENYEGGKLQLRLWPINDHSRYIEIKNLPFLAEKEFQSVPTRVTTYKSETEDSLKDVQKQAFSDLKEKKESFVNYLNKKHNDGTFAQSFYTGMFDAFFPMLPSGLTEDPRVLWPLGIAIEVGINAASLHYW